MKMCRRINLYLFFCLSVVLFSSCVAETEFGIKDTHVHGQIVRANRLTGFYQNKEYRKIESILLKDLASHRSDRYARQHILHELADLYSYLILDLEKAIEADLEIRSMGTVTGSGGRYALAHSSARNLALINDAYRKKYLNVAPARIVEISQKRRERNEKLLNATPIQPGKSYTEQFLERFILDVKKDIRNTYAHTNDQYEIISRLIRGEYELHRVTRDLASIKDGYRYLLDGTMDYEDVVLSEIDFLGLADYLMLAFRKTKEIELAEHALYIVYKPYIHLRDKNHRWSYNKLVNRYVNTLIKENFEQGKLLDAFYYISLNKSRMILEDRLSHIHQTENIRGLLQARNYLLDPKTGLPDKANLRKKIADTETFLDLYVDGRYIAARRGSELEKELTRDNASSNVSLRSLSLRKKRKSDTVDLFKGDNLYVTRIENGKIEAMKKLDQDRTTRIKRNLDKMLERIYQNPRARVSDNGEVKRLMGLTDSGGELIISPDKWTSKYPYNLIFDAKTVRALNLLSYDEDYSIESLRLVGYFNPTGDLVDAEREAEIIERIIPDSTLYLRGEASIDKMKQPLEKAILHLSMHGYNNEENSMYSKLLFAGSRLDPSTDDPNALYAADMVKYAQLRNNALLFTAACETGKIEASTKNQSEILGILRPLLINNNRNIILTLWEIESRSAADFVTKFYNSLAETNNVKIAFFHAQNVIKEKYGSPFYWAPYYLIHSN